ncbi:predicted protein [Streptomyces sp. C]|nr:predicted protein [Streptomyces sp. C]
MTPRHLSRGVFVHPLGVHCDVGGDGPDGFLAGPDSSTSADQCFLDGLQRAVGCGATLMDTADSYGQGHSERLIGRFLREHPAGLLHLSSKVGRLRGSAPHPYAGRHIHHQFQQTLENLYVEELALYSLDSLDFGPGDRYLGSAIEQMRTLRQLGAIKAIGMRGPELSYGVSPAELTAYTERFLYLFRLIQPDVLWTPFNALTLGVLLEGENLLSFTARHGVGLVLAAPLAHGPVTDRGARSQRQEPGSTAAALTSLPSLPSGPQAVREDFGGTLRTLTQLALRAALQLAGHCIVVAGARNAGQARENFGSLSPSLTRAELSLIDDIYSWVRAGLEDPQAQRTRWSA